jgi:hypothetical protein
MSIEKSKQIVEGGAAKFFAHLQSTRANTIYKIEQVEAEGYKRSMDIVRLTQDNGYHLNDWSLESLRVNKLFGARDKRTGHIICGVAVDDTGFISAMFKLDKLASRNGISKVMRPLLHAAISQGGGRTLGCFGSGLVAPYMKCGFMPVFKTQNSQGWDGRHGEKDVYFLALASFDNENIRLEHVENKLPKYENVFTQGIPLVRHIGDAYNKDEIARNVLSGGFLKNKDSLLKEGLEHENRCKHNRAIAAHGAL